MKTNNIRLYNDDCLNILEQLANENTKVDLILTDLPYGVTNCKWDTPIPLDKIWKNIKRIRNPSTPILLFGTEPFSSTLRMSNLQEYKYDWVWDKVVGTNIFSRKYQPLNDYELISVFYQKSGQYYPIMYKKEDKNRSLKIKNKGDARSKVYGMNLGNTRREYVDTGWRYPKRIITVNSQAKECNNHNRFHSSQKPVELLKYLIKTYTQEDDIVLDFTMGSGSTGVACKELNRGFIGIELEKEYYDIASERINEANVQRRLI